MAFEVRKSFMEFYGVLKVQFLLIDMSGVRSSFVASQLGVGSLVEDLMEALGAPL